MTEESNQSYVWQVLYNYQTQSVYISRYLLINMEPDGVYVVQTRGVKQTKKNMFDPHVTAKFFLSEEEAITDYKNTLSFMQNVLENRIKHLKDKAENFKIEIINS